MHITTTLPQRMGQSNPSLGWLPITHPGWRAPGCPFLDPLSPYLWELSALSPPPETGSLWQSVGLAHRDLNPLLVMWTPQAQPPRIWHEEMLGTSPLVLPLDSPTQCFAFALPSSLPRVFSTLQPGCPQPLCACSASNSGERTQLLHFPFVLITLSKEEKIKQK